VFGVERARRTPPLDARVNETAHMYTIDGQHIKSAGEFNGRIGQRGMIGCEWIGHEKHEDSQRHSKKTLRLFVFFGLRTRCSVDY
jgi:hypothetical protein